VGGGFFCFFWVVGWVWFLVFGAGFGFGFVGVGGVVRVGGVFFCLGGRGGELLLFGGGGGVVWGGGGGGGFFGGNSRFPYPDFFFPNGVLVLLGVREGMSTTPHFSVRSDLFFIRLSRLRETCLIPH